MKMHKKVKAFCQEQEEIANALEKELKCDSCVVDFYEIFPAFEVVRINDFHDFCLNIEPEKVLAVNEVEKLIPYSLAVFDQKTKKKRIRVVFCFSFLPEDAMHSEEQICKVLAKISKKVKTNIEVCCRGDFATGVLLFTVSYLKNPDKILQSNCFEKAEV